MTKVAINGFGRIGRLAFRQMFEAEGYEVIAINKSLSTLSQTQLSFLGVSLVLMLCSSALVSTLLRRRLLHTFRLVQRRWLSLLLQVTTSQLSFTTLTTRL